MNKFDSAVPSLFIIYEEDHHAQKKEVKMNKKIFNVQEEIIYIFQDLFIYTPRSPK